VNYSSYRHSLEKGAQANMACRLRNQHKEDSMGQDKVKPEGREQKIINLMHEKELDTLGRESGHIDGRTSGRIDRAMSEDAYLLGTLNRLAEQYEAVRKIQKKYEGTALELRVDVDLDGKKAGAVQFVEAKGGAAVSFKEKPDDLIRAEKLHGDIAHLRGDLQKYADDYKGTNRSNPEKLTDLESRVMFRTLDALASERPDIIRGADDPKGPKVSMTGLPDNLQTALAQATGVARNT
jgi:hypothetical protein